MQTRPVAIAIVAAVAGGSPALCDVFVSFMIGGQDIRDAQLTEFQTHSIEMWLHNSDPATVSLSSYKIVFGLSDTLQAKNWQESDAFDALSAPWNPVDQLLDTQAGDDTVIGTTGSLSAPFVGPPLSSGTTVMISTFDLFVNIERGNIVNLFINTVDSELVDQDGNAVGFRNAGQRAIEVVPEPTSLLLLVMIGAASVRCR